MQLDDDERFGAMDRDAIAGAPRHGACAGLAGTNGV